jgi:hypothetical protein
MYLALAPEVKIITGLQLGASGDGFNPIYLQAISGTGLRLRYIAVH